MLFRSEVVAGVTNDGPMDGSEIIQAYIEYPNQERMPIRELKAFHRLLVRHGEEVDWQLSIPVSELQKWDLATGKWKLYPGDYHIVLGSHSRDEKLTGTFAIAP